MDNLLEYFRNDDTAALRFHNAAFAIPFILEIDRINQRILKPNKIEIVRKNIDLVLEVLRDRETQANIPRIQFSVLSLFDQNDFEGLKKARNEARYALFQIGIVCRFKKPISGFEAYPPVFNGQMDAQKIFNMFVYAGQLEVEDRLNLKRDWNPRKRGEKKPKLYRAAHTRLAIFRYIKFCDEERAKSGDLEAKARLTRGREHYVTDIRERGYEIWGMPDVIIAPFKNANVSSIVRSLTPAGQSKAKPLPVEEDGPFDIEI